MKVSNKLKYYFFIMENLEIKNITTKDKFVFPNK